MKLLGWLWRILAVMSIIALTIILCIIAVGLAVLWFIYHPPVD